MNIRLDALARELGGTLEGDGSLEITGIAGLPEAGPGDVSFVAGKQHLGDLAASGAGAVIAGQGIAAVDKAVIRVANAYLAFAAALRIFHPPAHMPPGIDATAVVDGSAAVDPSASVGPFCCIAAGVSIGPRAVLAAHCVVGAGSVVGADTFLHPHVVVADKVSIGSHVIIHSGTVIGSDGFGYIHDGNHHCKIPQTGGVEIGDDVEIGANVTIDRATVGTTRIGRGSKIDNLVQIAHNVVIGEDTIIVALVGISGSTRIGNGVVLGGQVGIAGHLVVGDGARIGARSGIIRNIDAGETASGIGPLPHRTWLRAQAAFEKLPEFRRRLKEIEAKIAALEQESSDENV